METNARLRAEIGSVIIERLGFLAFNIGFSTAC